MNDVSPLPQAAAESTARKTDSSAIAPVSCGSATTSASPPGQDRHVADLDGRLHATEGRFTGGLSPTALDVAFLDWGIHLANAPFRRVELAKQAATQLQRFAMAVAGMPAITPPPTDHRFADPAWQPLPFNLMAQAFLLAEEWWAQAATGTGGVNRANQRIVSFTIRQLVDIFSPSNIPWLNPEVIQATAATGGRNLVAGLQNLLADVQATSSGQSAAMAGFRLGHDLAATPGRIVVRNELIELMQYAPTTPMVGREPVLIVPAWIMKYYILDLSPHNSLIRFLVAQGHTVFAISWRNPGADMADTSLDDYRTKGVMAALDAVSDICAGAKVHACGYCLGGTLLTIAAAAMARDGDDRLASATMFCAQTDFTEAGELQLFINEDQLAFLDDMMRAQGFLDTRQMTGAFQLLRSNDLIWSRAIRSYLLGEPDQSNDLMAWNADATRMPARMHSEYLHRLFLDNALAEGRFIAGGKPIAMNDIRVPIFMVGTETDHIAPWRSVYKIHLLTDGDLTFVLTSGGHNAGVVSEPGHPRRHFRIASRATGARYIGPDEWQAQTERHEGSWWPAWWSWLRDRSSGEVTPPAIGSARYPATEDAPGRYIFEH